MAHVQLVAQARHELGSAASRRLRRRGLIPGVVYQKGQESIPVTLPDRELRRLLHGDGARTAVVEITVDGESARITLLKDWQVEPVRGQLLHVDFQQVDLTVAVRAQVAVVLVGEPAGVRDGGVLDQVLREVTVEALPDNLPDMIEHDVSGLTTDGALHVGDLSVPPGVEIIDDPEIAVASILTPSLVEEVEGEEEAAEGEAPAAEAAAEEPSED
ncbi:MAG: large subunit ribosomal protein [Miltoncostaeaceae bacterium]|jgi:large subunit ribosomal protein L25|nr:large subunit ribosomal protein [Miltoncostaeaceae bacterium]